MNFSEILEEALNTKELSTKVGRMKLFSGMLASEIRKYIQSDNPRYILKNLWGAAQNIITPEKLETYKSFLKDQEDVLMFLNMVQNNLRIPSGYKNNFLRMIIDKFPVSDYSYSLGPKGEPSLTRSRLTQFKHPVNESVITKEILDHDARWVFFRIKEELPTLKSNFSIAQIVLKNMGKELHQFHTKQLNYFVRRLENYIKHHNHSYKGGLMKYLTLRQNPEDIYASTSEPEPSHLRVENNNPYLTQAQKYTKNHPNQDGHQHSMRRTTGNDTARKTKSMVPKVRQNLKNPYESNVANQAQTKSKVLTPLEIQQMSNDYGLDFNDRRVKTMKGKTNMILTPLSNGGWKLEHR